MGFFRRLFGLLRTKETPPRRGFDPAPLEEPAEDRERQSASPFAHLFGPPEGDTPIVMVSKGSTLVITDRLSYEYQQGLARGSDPSQTELERVLERMDRLRVLSGGMMRDQPLGTEVLLDTRDRSQIAAFRTALQVEENPETFAHCACLGGPTVECYAGRGLVATLSFHHGHSIRWHRWKHDARLVDAEPLLAWLGRHRIDPDPNKGSEDVMQLQLLALGDAERLAYRAQSHLARGELLQAHEDCGRAVATDPSCALAFGVRALVHRSAQRSAECEADCDAAIRLGLEHPEVYFARAFARYARGELDASRGDCDAALALAPEHAGALNSRGLIHAQLGQIDKARADLDRAVELAPSWPVPLGNRANLCVETGSLDRALADYTEAITLLERAAEAASEGATSAAGGESQAAYHAMRGRVYQLMGDVDAADEDLDRAVTLAPEDTRAWLARGQIALENGRLEAALADYSEVIRLRPDLVDGYFQRAQVHMILGDGEEAVGDLDEALRWSPESVDVALMRGQCLMHLGRLDDAMRDLDRVIGTTPQHALAYYFRALVWGKRGEFARKRDDLEQTVNLAPEWSDPCNSLAWLLATCPDGSVRNGPRAVEMGRRALEHSPDPGKAACLDTLAAALAENGEFGEAIDRQREAIGLMDDPDRRIRYEQRLILYEEGEPYREDEEG
jgi:serine/threonine-protein kinase